MTFPLNTWYAVIGSNTTFSNHDATTLRPGFLFGIGRNYYLSETVYLQGEAVYNQRRFLLPAQRIRYISPSRSELWHSDVNFSEAYIDVALLTKIRIIVFANAKLSVALGPALSVPILDKTSYDVQTRERVEIGSRVPYDFSYKNYEPGPTSPYLGLLAAIEFETSRLSLKTSLNHALYTSNQIYPLRNETRLNTLMFALGYRL